MRMPVRPTAAGVPRTYNEFIEALGNSSQQTPFDPRIALFSISHYSRTIGMYSHANEVPVTCQGFATAAYALLTHFQPFPPFEPPNFRAWNDNLTQAFVTNAENVIEIWQRLPPGPNHLEEAKLSLLRVVAESGLYQQEVVYKIANTLILTGFKRYGRLPIANSQIENLFQSQLQASAFDFYILLYGIWSVMVSTPSFNIPDLMRQIRRRDHFSRLTETVCDELSMTVESFDPSNLNNDLESISAKFRGSAYFSLKPFISLGQNYYACVAHPFLRTHITSKFTQKALALARQAEPGSGGKTTLSDFMGKTRLEGFFKELCDHFIFPGNHVGEFKYQPGKDSADRMIFEELEGENICTLVQLKQKALPTSVHFAESWQEISDDFAKAFSDCIFKSINFLFQIERANANGQISPNAHHSVQRILGCDQFLFLGVVPDLPQIFSICYAREALMERVLFKISQKRNLEEWFNQKFPQGIKWHIFDLTEFQYFLSLPRGTLIAKELQEYLTEARVDEDPFDREGNMTPTFKNFLIGRHGVVGTDGIRRLKLDSSLEFLMHDVSRDMKYFLFKPFWQRWFRCTFNFLREKFYRLVDRVN